MDENDKKTMFKTAVDAFNGNRILFSVIFALGALFIASSAAAVFFYKEYSDLIKNPQKVAQKETERLLKKVSRLMALPEEEMPTIATVTDPEKLKEQQFFSNAKLGDKVLIFTGAKKAILYDESANKILGVASINTD
ncbi:MAG: hypothetical protein AAB355_00920 [Patescibacteria group bacterium]